MNPQTEMKSKALWKSIPALCFILLIVITQFGKGISESNQLIIIVVILLISLGSTVMWIRDDKKTNAPNKYKAQLFFAFMLISILICVAGYFTGK